MRAIAGMARSYRATSLSQKRQTDFDDGNLQTSNR